MIHAILKYFYNLLFGKNYEDIWKQFAKECNGTFIEASESKVEVNYKDHLLTIGNHTHYVSSGGSTYEREYLRAKLDFKSTDRLELLITPQDIFENAAKLFGAQDIETGDKTFDRKFMLRGNDAYKIQTLLANDNIKQLISKLKIIRFAITEETGIFDEKAAEGYSMVYYISSLKVKETATLHTLYHLMTEVTDGLINIASLDLSSLHQISAK